MAACLRVNESLSASLSRCDQIPPLRLLRSFVFPFHRRVASRVEVRGVTIPLFTVSGITKKLTIRFQIRIQGRNHNTSIVEIVHGEVRVCRQPVPLVTAVIIPTTMSIELGREGQTCY